MAMNDKSLPRRTREPRAVRDSPYAFQDLLRDVPLSADDEGHPPQITCVDFWDGNLYIGASNGELLHLVSIPGETDSDPPTFILASRLEPQYNALPEGTDHPGVQQILVLPSAKKACVVCNGTLTFYTLPELSPAFGGKLKQGDCLWIGGLDESHDYQEDEDVVIIMCLKQRLRLIRIGEQARKVRNIELPGCVTVRRRGDLACVADGRAYSLIDVVNQQKNELFPISSAPMSPPRSPPKSEWPSPFQTPEVNESRPRPLSMQLPPSNTRSPTRSGPRRNHERIVSMGAMPAASENLRPDSPSQWPQRASSRLSIEGTDSPARSRSPLAVPALDSPRAASPQPPPTEQHERGRSQNETLKPIISSPSPTEFLLTTGTSEKEPGVGMFVNEEGDVSRGTIEFASYPKALILDSAGTENSDGERPSESYVIALTAGGDDNALVLEIQSIGGDGDTRKTFLRLPEQNGELTLQPGVCSSTSQTVISNPGFVSALGQRRLQLLESGTELDAQKVAQEDQLIQRYATNVCRCIFFAGNQIWWLVRHPLLISLDSQLEAAMSYSESGSLVSIQRHKVEHVFNDLRGREPQDEIQFMTYNYIRQKAAAMLFFDLLTLTNHVIVAPDRDIQYTQDALISSDIEPRVVLSLVPALKAEVFEGPAGIWIPGGLNSFLESITSNQELTGREQESSEPYRINVLPAIKALLVAWRKKKGFGSVSDEELVFKTVDAALVHVLLLLDRWSPPGPASAGSLRAELNEVMDRGVDSFDRVVTLLEKFHRLYLLSRLYQNKKMSALVLATWKRILEGEEDRGGELVDGEADVRKYLGRIKDANLVREYGTWLANRNPSLGVQIFADDSSRVKFSTTEAVELLKAKAPNAVRHYLEYLVFAKNQPQYSEDLINFYLEELLKDLSVPASSAIETLNSVNEIYSALPPPKPTYMQFILDNAPQADWHEHRLRLMQLLETTPNKSKLDWHSISSRLDPYAEQLIPETVILLARQSQHKEALRLLVHSLADFDTAIRYCLRAGTRIFQPARLDDPPPPPEAQQNPLLDLLLHECMALPDQDALERSAELLQRFGTRFDLAAVLPRVPPEWPVAVMRGFLDPALRGLVAERRESAVLKGLAASQNLRVAVEQVEKVEKAGVVWQEKGEPGAASWADSGYGTSLGTEEGTEE